MHLGHKVIYKVMYQAWAQDPDQSRGKVLDQVWDQVTDQSGVQVRTQVWHQVMEDIYAI